ncbi:enoyl-CoA hydratase/isomerase family protein [Planobispora longispora]|uniref:Enoyl-CoA hydratase n=1 Tax=Planobispora longispora TaxID=28887 RepID=A0A8J3RU40_9ACTN|nr:hypothetical protein [Planobispora longispora]BFE79389.1 hypothetical protein GCM10020093_019900 [Planobispora longispora]GIH78268.1 hypothetical protein Plo01_46970 [Planobispora longispora]
METAADQRPQETAQPVHDGLLVDIDGPVATLTLNRPERRNALTFALWQALAAAGQHLPRALEICLTARTVPADEAARLGLAETLVPREGLDAAVADLTTALLAVDAGAATATKRLLRQAPDNLPDQQYAAERAEQTGRLRALFGGATT